MEKVLKELSGKNVDLNCGNGAVFRGVVSSVEGEVVAITEASGSTLFVAIKQIISCTEVLEASSRPGFIG